jgi:hypothetical protein
MPPSKDNARADSRGTPLRFKQTRAKGTPARPVKLATRDPRSRRSR